MNQIPKHINFDGVFTDKMNSGLDWMWVEMLTVMVNWIELDFEKWIHGHLWSLG